MFAFMLKALKYKSADIFSADNEAQCRALVLWLENTKVRRYPIDGRAALQAAEPAAWEAGFRQYLIDLECPLDLETSNRREVLQWLLSHAVGLEYQDNADSLASAAERAAAEAPPPEEWTEQQLPPFSDILSQEVLDILLKIQQLLRTGGRGGTEPIGAPAARISGDAVTPASLEAAAAMLETQILPALDELAKQAQAPAAAVAAPGVSAGQAAAAALLRKFPNGISEEGEGGEGGPDLAATILRMLYIKDLRQLQTAVDSAIVQVQEYTANPRTDSKLGKVGR